jgi:uncharacterized protein YjbJ (UPF0337 family)
VKFNHISSQLRSILHNWKNRLFCTLAISTTCLGIALATTPAATAMPLEFHPPILGSDVVQKLDQKAKSDLDTVAGSGTSDRLEGQVDQAVGKVQKEFGKASGQVEGAVQQARGKAKEDIGTTRRSIEKTADQAEEASDNAIDSIKNFFSR